MNTLVSLVNEWDEFNQQYPESEIDDFCRYFLMKEEKVLSPEECAKDFGNLLKLTSNLMFIFDVLFKKAMSNTNLPFPSAYFFLTRIKAKGQIRKTELIRDMRAEYSTGMEQITKLLKAKLIKEHSDSKDKRVRLLSITKAGSKLLDDCFPYMDKVGTLMFGNANPVNMKICITFLNNIISFSESIALDEKSKDFDLLFELHKK
ncbi:MarR family winged helix-turn-helix transcriptional regulator [Flavobacterium dauae]|uniref:MarR family winged helix-turn-helix transcriptional regulator n=1 Tax=Flavobacterium dauae TaxID=1563479 RepID=UPI00101B4B14|nr:MarR family winged helix-turn-helix transcriptional regulator [Flavobacterium dauae]WLD23683.1 MarR family winged helix-turn-helix transcriptional regulator [Flavobacterium dauae]